MLTLTPYRRYQTRTYSPSTEMEAFNDLFGNFFGAEAVFRTDITDEGDHYRLEADLPGFGKENIRLELENNGLTITAERRLDKEERKSQSKYLRSERSYGCYTRHFDMTGIDTEAITAMYDNGVLTLELPKRRTAGARQLEIE